MEFVECTMKDVVGAINALENLRKAKISIKLSIDLRRMENLLRIEYDVFEKEEKKILDLHSQTDKEGKLQRPPLLDDENKPVFDKEGNPVFNPNLVLINDMDEFNKDMNELNDVKVKLQISKLPLSRIENLEVSYADASNLVFLIDQDL